jgi:glycerophosphoryl diester phosphodiesterase
MVIGSRKSAGKKTSHYSPVTSRSAPEKVCRLIPRLPLDVAPDARLLFLRVAQKGITSPAACPARRIHAQHRRLALRTNLADVDGLPLHVTQKMHTLITARRLASFLICALASASVPITAAAAEPAPPRAQPWIFAHRGASGERPEHTLAAYRLAMEEGADYIEPDLRRTKDGVFIALHDGTLNRTTDIAAHPEFADRAKLDKKKGEKSWAAADFTLAELRMLRCRQAPGRRPKDFDLRESIPTLEEIVDVVRAWNREHHANVGIVPELRGDAEAFIAFAREHKFGEAGSPPIYLQSFEAATLRTAREALHFPAALLFKERPDAKELRAMKAVFDSVAVGKAGCIADDSKAWIAEVHALGLQVIAWTFDDARFDKGRFASSQAEMECAFRNGADAIFTDFPASGVKARAAARGR